MQGPGPRKNEKEGEAVLSEGRATSLYDGEIEGSLAARYDRVAYVCGGYSQAVQAVSEVGLPLCRVHSAREANIAVPDRDRSSFPIRSGLDMEYRTGAPTSQRIPKAK